MKKGIISKEEYLDLIDKYIDNTDNTSYLSDISFENNDIDNGNSTIFYLDIININFIISRK